MEPTTTTRTSAPRRQSGIARVKVIGGLAASLVAGTAYWNLAGWRVERTIDRQACGIEKNLVGKLPWTVEMVDTELATCRALMDSKRSDCPIFTASAAERCRKVFDDHKVSPGRTRILITSHAPPAIRAQDTGFFSWAASVMRAGAHILMQPGGDGIPLTDADIYYFSSDKCLGIGVGGQKIVTAAHCVNEPNVDIEAKCIDQPTGAYVTTKYHCEPESTVYGGMCATADLAERARDIAVCQPADTKAPLSKSCLPTPGQAFDEASWSAPGLAAKAVWVAGMVPSWGVVIASAPAPKWPASAPPALANAELKGTIDPGDSGGPVFDNSVKPRKVIGISVCAGSVAQIVPLYQWKSKIAP